MASLSSRILLFVVSATGLANAFMLSLNNAPKPLMVLPFFNHGLKLDAVPCDNTKFQQCLAAVETVLNFTSLPADASVFAAAISAIINANGLSGFEDVCTGENMFEKCVGMGYSDCISTDNLQKNENLVHDQAMAYSSLFQVLQFECGLPAFSVIVGHWSCIITTENTQRSKLTMCQVDYEKNIINDYANLCKYTQEYLDCLDSVLDNCGADVEITLCQANKIAMSVSLPQCNLMCPTGSPKK